MSLQIKLTGIYLDLYFLFKKKLLYKDGYGLQYYLYKNTRPNDTFNLGVRTDDTTVLYVIDKILSCPSITNNSNINCFDVGGYIGIITLMMGKVLKNKKKTWRIHTFEPFEESFFKLKENIEITNFKENIILNKLAVSNMSGISALKTYENTPGENHLDFKAPKNKNNNTLVENINVTTLKEYIIKNSIEHINICKVDTEGSDYFVIKGLNEYLDNNIIDFFIFEYQSKTFEKIQDLLFAHGYTFYYMVRNEDKLVNSIENYPKNCKSLLNCIAVSNLKKNEFLNKFRTG